MIAPRVELLRPYVMRRLQVEKVDFFDKDKAEKSLEKCVLGPLLVKAYKEILNAT